MNNIFADREQCVFWIQIVSGNDHSGPVHEVTYPLLISHHRRRLSTRSVPGPRNTCLKREKPGL